MGPSVEIIDPADEGRMVKSPPEFIHPEEGDGAVFANSKLPRSVVAAIVAICVAPFLLTLFGFDFGAQGTALDASAFGNGPEVHTTDQLFRQMSGPFIHTILEWTAFCAGLFTVVLAMVHFLIKRDVVTPVIALSLFASACMDAFHTLAADRLIEAAADSRNLIPFTWAISRLFNAIILIVGVSIFLLKKEISAENGGRFLLVSSVALASISYLMIHLAGTSPKLPETMFPGAFFTRPWDVAPLALFLIAGLFIFPRFHRKVSTLFSHALLISIIPHVATQLHMVFGSSVLFDSHFNIAHLLKSVAYLVPLVGICCDQLLLYQEQQEMVGQLDTAVSRRTHELESSLNLLQESQTRAQAIVDAATDGIISYNEEGEIESINTAACRMFGCKQEESWGLDVSRLIPDRKDKKAVWFPCFTPDGGNSHEYREVEGLRADGTVFPMSLGVSQIVMGDRRLFTGIVRDLGNQKLMQAQLAHSQKLESIGELAAGIAHEINTPIQFVGDNTRFLEDAFADLDPVIEVFESLVAESEENSLPQELRERVDLIAESVETDYLKSEIPKAISQSLEGVDRVATIVRAMKDFSHPGAAEMTPVDLAKSIESTVTVSRNEWKYVAEVKTDFDSSLPPVPCIPQDMNQIILNLIVNAAHAIAENVKDNIHARGKITISTRRVGDFAEIEVRDDGVGIPKEVQARIFDPFFTTKGVGCGTGQGLAMAHTIIVDRHKGSIEVESEPGAGAAFKIRLPLNRQELGSNT